MSLSGNLKTVAFPDILQLLASGKKSGILECRTATRQKEVAFKDGNVVYASSLNSTEDLLGNLLLKRGKISKADLERAVTLHKQTGRQLGTTLIDMNLFDKDEIGLCLKMQIEEIVYNLFSWHEGDFVFHENVQPKNAPFVIELSTMSVIMEGTRRIDEWLEIQKVLPPDDILLRIAKSPKVNREELTISVDEFRMLALINGDRTVTELIELSPMGEFVTCRSVYRLILNNLIEVCGRREAQETPTEDEEEVLLSIVFHLYNKCFQQIRTQVESFVGENNARFNVFASQYRDGILSYFTGLDPDSGPTPTLAKFLAAVRQIPEETRFYALMSNLEKMLSDQLVYVYQLLGEGAYRDTITRVKKEITEPLQLRRELVKRFNLEDTFYTTLKRADKVVRLVRG
jgi:hypothetical protein